MADKASVRAQVKELTDKLAEGVKDLFSSDRYMEYLRTMSRFHTYSTRNTLLIHMQMPGATHVAGFRSWQSKFERHVKKGQKGIRILAPTPYTIKREEQARDPVTREFLFDNEGLPVTEEVEVHIPRFKAISVFDVSQTEGKPLPQLAEDLAGDVRYYDLFMDALRAVSPLPIKMEALPPTTDGVCRYGDSIGIREGMSESQTISAAVHEIGHAVLHDRTRDQEHLEESAAKDASTKEVEAESVSYAVCAYYGIETAPNSFGYLATWSSGKGLKELNASLDIIRKTAAGLIEDIDKQFHLLAKERGIDLAAEMGIDEIQPNADVPQPSQSEALEFAQDYVDFMGEIYEDGFIEGGPAEERLLVENTAANILAGDVQVVENNLRLAYEKDNDGELLGPDPAKMLARLSAFTAVAVPEQPETGTPAIDASMPEDVIVQPEQAEPAQGAVAPEQDKVSGETTHMPDPTITLEEQRQYGYTNDDMLPLQKNRALELFDLDYTVFLLHPNNTEEMAFDRSEIEKHDGIFGMEEEYWHESPEYLGMRGEAVQAEPVRVERKQEPDIAARVQEILDRDNFIEEAASAPDLMPGLLDMYTREGTPIGEQEAAMLAAYARATMDKRLTLDFAADLAYAGFERTFGEVNPAVELDVRDEIALWEAQDPIFALARDINQFFSDNDQTDREYYYKRSENRKMYHQLLDGDTYRTLSWIRAEIRPTRIEQATSLVDRINSLDFDTPYKLAEDIRTHIAGTAPDLKEIWSTFTAFRGMDPEAFDYYESALRGGHDEKSDTGSKQGELLDRLKALKDTGAASCAGEPMVKIDFSESNHLIRDQVLPLSTANKLMQKLDAEQGPTEEHTGAYDKTDFTIFYTRNQNVQQYRGRYDIGDGDGGLIDHIRRHAEYALTQENLAEKHADYRDILGKFVPYLKHHDQLADKQAEGAVYLANYNNNSNMVGWAPLIQSARLYSYVKTCRLILNTRAGAAPFPPLPLPGEVDGMGAQLAGMHMSESSKDFVIANSQADVFGLYQLKDTDNLHYHRYAHLEELHKDGNEVERGNYNLMYAAPITGKASIGAIFEQFEFARPDSFKGHSPSTSDVVVFNVGGTIFSYYLNGTDAIELPDFLGHERNISQRLAEDIDAFLFDYGKAGQFSDTVNSRLITSAEGLESAIVSKAPVVTDIREMLCFVAENDEDSGQQSKAAAILSRLEAFNPPRRDEPAIHLDKPSLLATLNENKKIVGITPNTPKDTAKHNSDREV